MYSAFLWSSITSRIGWGAAFHVLQGPTFQRPPTLVVPLDLSLSLVLLSLLHCSALIASLLCMWEDLAPARCDGPAALLLVCGSDVDGVRLEKM